MHAWQAGALDGTPLSADDRERLGRAARVEELAELLTGLATEGLPRALFLATLFCVTWEKVHWHVAGAVGLADVLTVLFLVAFALEWGASAIAAHDGRSVLAFFAALLVIYLSASSTSRRSSRSTSGARAW